MNSHFTQPTLLEPVDQIDGKWVNTTWEAGKALVIILLCIYCAVLLLYFIVLFYKLPKYEALRKFINFYLYISIFWLLSLRIISTGYLMKAQDLIWQIEVAAISFFILCNAAIQALWVRRTVLFRFEESSEYYSKIRKYFHIWTALVILTLLIIQTLGLYFKIWVYVNVILEIIFVILNTFITYKIIKSFQVFEFHETKSTLRWIYVIAWSSLVSFIVRIFFNIASFFGQNDYPISEMDLEGKDKLIHLATITVIELIPWLIWILYISSSRGEIERSLSVRSADIYGGQRIDIAGTISGSRESNLKSSLMIEQY